MFATTKIEKRESPLKSALMQLAKTQLPRFELLRHEDVRSSGHPDLSATGLDYTSWWEFKHATPDFESNALQELTCRRLNANGFCRYVIWQENAIDAHQRTLIVNPEAMSAREGWALQPEIWWMCFDHAKLLHYIKHVHILKARR